MHHSVPRFILLSKSQVLHYVQLLFTASEQTRIWQPKNPYKHTGGKEKKRAVKFEKRKKFKEKQLLKNIIIIIYESQLLLGVLI
jgi:hypothetical protein